MKQLTYIMGDRADFERWRRAHPEVGSVIHIPNEHSARGAVLTQPAPTVVVLPTANPRAVSELHFKGFDVPITTAKPKPYPLVPAAVYVDEVDPICKLLEEWMLGPGNANAAERLSGAVQCFQLSLVPQSQFILDVESALAEKGAS